jgi:hypothetical protein
MRQLLLVIVCACVLGGSAARAVAETPRPPEDGTTITTTTISAAPTARTVSDRDDEALRLRRTRIRHRIAAYRRETWRWQRVMGMRLIRALPHAPRALEARAPLWRRVAVRTRRRAQHPPHLGGWLCIHRYEGSWRDSGGPYYGGLQMDLSFQRRYGAHLLARKGPANHWTPLEQMWTAERAFRAGRGYYPWPNTARNCGLI